MKIALVNFTHSNDTIGGVETRYRLLNDALNEQHDCHFLATKSTLVEDAVRLTESCDLAILDSGVAFATVCPMITIFGNPWRAVKKYHPPHSYMEEMIARESRWHTQNNSLRVAVSNYMKEDANQNGIACHQVIPNPADLERFSPQAVDNKKVAWVGPRIPLKNVEQFERIQADIPGVDWLPLCRIGNEPALAYDEITEQLPACSATLCTSWAEGCSNTLMESLAASVPIITTKSGLFWDWWDCRLGERIDDPSDTTEFVGKLSMVLDHQDRYAPRQAAIDAGLDLLTWSTRWLQIVSEHAR